MERGKERRIEGGREEVLTMIYLHSLVHYPSHPLQNMYVFVHIYLF